MLTSVSLPNLDSIPEPTLILVPIYYRIESPILDGHIPYVMNHERELNFFDLEPALDPTLEPKLTFQELVLFQEDLDTHTPPKEKVESYCEDECDKDELLFQAKFEDEFNKFCEENFVRIQRFHLIRFSQN